MNEKGRWAIKLRGPSISLNTQPILYHRQTYLIIDDVRSLHSTTFGLALMTSHVPISSGRTQ